MALRSLPWNSVDVLGDDGLLRYGRVVDVEDQGLFVDFLYSGRRRQFIPFYRAFPLDKQQYRSGFSQTQHQPGWKAEVLMRDGASNAWMWFPTEIVSQASGIGYASDYRVVIVHRGTPQEYVDVVPMARIRWNMSVDGRIKIGNKYRKSAVDLPKKCVEKWTFAKHTLLLPESRTKKFDEKPYLQRMIYFHENSARAVYVDIVDDCLVYIQRRCNAGAEPKDSRTANALKFASRFYKALLRSIEPKPLVQLAAADGLALLPTELWTEVFSNLDTATQARLRPVCATWDALLSSAYLKANVVFDRAAFVMEDREGCSTSAYFMASVLFKCLSSSTKHVVVVDQQCQTERMQIMEVFDILQYLTAQRNPGLKLKCIHLFGLQCCLPSCLCNHQELPEYGLLQSTCSNFTNTIMACRSLRCENIQLIQCTITVKCRAFSRYHSSGGVSLDPCYISLYRQRFSGELDGALWSALEAGLSVPTDTELTRLANLLRLPSARCHSTPLQAHDRLTRRAEQYSVTVSKSLCALQTTDPRPSLHYRGKKWCVDGLQGLELEKLSRVALRSLIKLMEALPK